MPRLTKRVSIQFTEKQLWALVNSYEASFTDPDCMNATERRVQEKLTDAHLALRKRNRA